MKVDSLVGHKVDVKVASRGRKEAAWRALPKAGSKGNELVAKLADGWAEHSVGNWVDNSVLSKADLRAAKWAEVKAVM